MEAPVNDRQMLSELLGERAAGEFEDSEPPSDTELIEYLAGRLSAAEAERIRGWVAAHPQEGERLFALEHFRASTTSSDDVTDFEMRLARGRWTQRIAAEEAAAKEGLRSSPRLNHWLAAAAAIFFISTCGLALRVFELQQVVRQPVANLRTFEILGEVRTGAEGEEFDISVGVPFRVTVYPAELPAGCEVYRAALVAPEALPHDTFDLRPAPSGRLDLLLPGEPGEWVLELTACGEERGTFPFVSKGEN